jgi:ABC-2 type transport system permease protein
MLSGFLFEIKSMPWVIQLLTYLIPPRYFVTILQTSFLAGPVWELYIPNLLALIGIALLFLLLVKTRIVKSLD